jgi:F0F1-type ATP synthase assembly protein I
VGGPGVRERFRVFTPERPVRVRQGEMAKKDSRFSFARSTQVFQENVNRAGPAATASYSLIGAIVVLGGLGYAADRWFGWAPWGAFAGLMLGLVVGFYELVKATRR